MTPRLCALLGLLLVLPIATMVLAASVNKSLVQALTKVGVPAVGLCGADGWARLRRSNTPR